MSNFVMACRTDELKSITLCKNINDPSWLNDVQEGEEIYRIDLPDLPANFLQVCVDTARLVRANCYGWQDDESELKFWLEKADIFHFMVNGNIYHEDMKALICHFGGIYNCKDSEELWELLPLYGVNMTELSLYKIGQNPLPLLRKQWLRRGFTQTWSYRTPCLKGVNYCLDYQDNKLTWNTYADGTLKVKFSITLK